MNADPKNVGDRIAETPVIVNNKRLTVSTVRLDVSSYDTTIFDDSDGKQHHGMRLGDGWIIGWGQQSGTLDGAMHDHREALCAARTEQPRPLN
jgi:hypothetical protein